MPLPVVNPSESYQQTIKYISRDRIQPEMISKTMGQSDPNISDRHRVIVLIREPNRINLPAQIYMVPKSDRLAPETIPHAHS